MFKKYLEKIAKTTLHGDQREESYYPAIANLITDFANSLHKKKVSITILPKKTEAGNPDFRVWDGDHEIIGYIEAKIPNTDLDKTENSEQLKRYLTTFPNVILTNFYEFRLYRQGELIKQVTIGRYFEGEDPIIHFYETFLNQYDPATREKRGVYYTPSAVVKYIVNSVEEILKKDFDKIGFADHTVKVLDPAGGTLTFLAEAVKKALTTFVEYFGNGNQKSFIKGHILQNFYGFELMMSPYAIAHLKMSYLLQEYGYNFEDCDRFQLYLTNTLDAKMSEIRQLPGLSSLAEEATEANLIKKETPVLAIIGNPPYSIASYSSFRSNPPQK